MKTDPQYVNPPKILEAFLHWSLPKGLKEPIVGDLSEEFNQLVAAKNRVGANYWYLRQALLTAIRYLWKTKRGMVMFVFGILFFIAMFLMALLMSGDFAMFVNIPSLLVVFPPAVLLTIGITSKSTFTSAFRLIFDDELDAQPAALNQASHVFAVMGNSSLWLGGLGMVIGHVAMAAHIDSESFSKVFGPALSVSLLTMFYALLIKVLCYVGEQKIKHRLLQVE